MEHMDFALACGAVETAVSRMRNPGTVYTPTGLTFLQTGKDLRK